MVLLTAEERSAITSRSEALNKYASITSITVAKLYRADPDPDMWTYTDVWGAVVVMFDRKLESCILRIYDLQNYDVVFEYELYENCEYTINLPYFHTFEMNDCMAGLSFADEGEAKSFASKVRSLIPKGERNTNDDKKEVKSKGFLGMFKGKEEMQIGDVSSYKHESHVGISTDGSFDLKNIPNDWKKMFKENGITKKELTKNPELANKMLKIMQESGGVPPPPPMKPKSKAAPPAVAPRKSIAKASPTLVEEEAAPVEEEEEVVVPVVPTSRPKVPPPRREETKTFEAAPMVTGPRAPPPPARGKEKPSVPLPPPGIPPREEEVAPVVVTSAPKIALPGPPRGNLLASIQGFNKSNLKKGEDEEEEAPKTTSGPPKGGLMGAIQGFNKGALKTATVATPEEKKAQQRRASTETGKPTNMFDQLQQAMQAIRENVKNDDDSDGSDWST